MSAVMNRKGREFEWVWSDRDHLEAHIRDFLQEPEALLDIIYRELASFMPEEQRITEAVNRKEELWFQQSFTLSEPVGKTGLINVCEEEIPSFWGYRTGRSIPSHLCFADKELTKSLCLWGRWEPGKFIIHTMYPGVTAPREIHDTALPLEELQAAVDFWRCHAIVVNKGDFTAV